MVGMESMEGMDRTQIIGEKVLNLRSESGITQKLLAEYLEIDQSYVSKIESGERPLSLDMLTKISDLFGCKREYFIKDNVEHTPMSIAFRSHGFGVEDLETIAVMNKIALNLKFMDEIK